VSLRSKIVRTLLVLVAAFALLDHLAQRLVLLPSFAALQRTEALAQLDRAARAITAQARHLDLNCASLSQLAGLRDFALGQSDQIRSLVLDDRLLAAENLDLAFVIGAEKVAGTQPVVWSALSERMLGSEGRLSGFPRGGFDPNHPLLATAHGLPTATHGLLASERGPLLVSSRPIAAPGESGVGWLVFGALLPGDRLQQLSVDLGLGCSTWTVDDQALPAEIAALKDELTASAEPIVVDRSGDELALYTTLLDIQARPTVLLRTATPRAIYGQGRTAVFYALLSAVGVGLAMLLVLQRLLGRVVLTPLAELTAHAVEIGRSDDASRRIGFEREDEIGVLAKEFDSMLAKLATSRAAVVSAARSAGMSEIATGILHNIGNVLNSVVLGAELADEQLRRTKLPQLERLVELLEQQPDLVQFVGQDPRGTKLVPFLRALCAELEGERGALDGELRTVRQGIEHIRELVASQQAYAGRSRVDENISLGEQIERAVELTASSAGGADAVEVQLELEPLPAVPMDRHKLLEILVNLLQNARQSVHTANPADPVVRVSLAASGPRTVQIRVADNGVGIAPENLAKIFGHGFTTKRNGHGFGLHSAANSAKELSGRLTVSSSGLGQGAEFCLELELDRDLAPPAAAA
jgi:two-component system NtrC family sensor kinase